MNRTIPHFCLHITQLSASSFFVRFNAYLLNSVLIIVPLIRSVHVLLFLLFFRIHFVCFCFMYKLCLGDHTSWCIHFGNFSFDWFISHLSFIRIWENARNNQNIYNFKNVWSSEVFRANRKATSRHWTIELNASSLMLPPIIFIFGVRASEREMEREKKKLTVCYWY